MENEIKNIYNTLSGGKIILSDNSIISSSHFNSISADRFISELKKRGINWDGADIEFSDLINNIGNSKSSMDFRENVEKYDNNLELSTSQVGIDIQEISELPDPLDYWEDEFYISKFSKEEIAYCVIKDNPKQSFAGLYSCKEALIKCDYSLFWDDINITHSKSGKPQFKNYYISISHSGLYALSVAFKLDMEQNNIIRFNENEFQKTFSDFESKNEVNSNKISIIVLFSILALIISYIVYNDFIIN
jgi:phosphopantetheine--protein transferase-like protein